MRVFGSTEELRRSVGEHLGYSSWHVVSQKRVNQFADATMDHQWIHVDPVRAADGPFGGSIAHGYLTLSLASALVAEVFRLDEAAALVNYGANRVRFPSPVPVGARVRAGVELAAAEPVTHGDQLTLRVTIEIEGARKPACVAELLAIVQ